LTYDIEVDGGIDVTTAPQCAAAGATVFVTGNTVFKSGASIAEAIGGLRKVL
jgi:ribulose-phosphate 3-epimerase